jgi:hypothetical protein
MAGSTSGVLTLILILSLMVVIIISVVMYLKRRQKAFNLTSNVAYAGRCKNEDNDYYAISQPPAPGTDVEMKDEHLVAIVILPLTSPPKINHYNIMTPLASLSLPLIMWLRKMRRYYTQS